MRILILFNLLSYMSLANAATYYVSPAGNNANSGTSTLAPWKTITFALNQANDGDVINLMAGTYTGKITWPDGGVAGSYITLQNYNDDVVILDGATIGNSQALLYIENKNYIKIDGLQFTNHNGNYQPVINIYGNCSHIEISNCTFFNTNCNESYAILCEGRGDDIKIMNNTMQDLIGDNAVGVLFVGSNTTTPFSNILISGNTLTNLDPAPSEAIAVNGNIDGFEISNNTLVDINNIGIVMIGGEDWVNTNPLVNFARNGVCRNNYVADANSIYGGGFAGGIYVDGGKNIIVENNTVTGSDVGMEIGCENMGFIAENITVRNNLLYKNEKSGLGFGGYDFPATGQVQNCTFTGNTVFDNDLLNTGFGQLWIQYALNCTVENNIFYASTSAWMVNAETINTGYNNLLDYNTYYYSGGEANAKFLFDFDYLVGYSNFTTATGMDTHSMFTDPLFVNFAAVIPDLHLQNTSPCINAGNPTYTGITDPADLDIDLQARIQGTGIDMGADETVSLPLAMNASSTPVTCYGSCNGVLNFSGLYGCPPYILDYKNPGGGSWIAFTGPVTGVCAGTYKCRITDACGAVVTQNIVIQQDPALTISVTSITNETIAGAGNGKITVNSSGGYGSKSYSINGGVTWQTSKKFMGLSAGTYTIWVKDGHNCMSSVNATVGVGGKMEDQSDYSIYPNPAHNLLFISLPDASENQQVEIRTISGSILYQSTTESNEITIDVSAFPAGCYIVRIGTKSVQYFIKN